MDDQKREITAAVATRIRSFRKKAAMSQEELALKANLNPAYLGQVERGLKCPTVDTLYKIASALDISPAEFLRPPVTEDMTQHSQQISEILSRIPPDKREQALALFENIAELFS